MEEATRRSAVVWLRPAGAPRAVPAWHLWHEGAAHVVTGPGEQPLPGVHPGGRVLVVVRSKERQGDRLVQWWADVERVQPARWAREATVLRLVPDGTQEPVR